MISNMFMDGLVRDDYTEAYLKLECLNAFMNEKINTYTKKSKKTTDTKNDLGTKVREYIANDKFYEKFKRITAKKVQSIEQTFLKVSGIYLESLNEDIANQQLKLEGTIKYIPMTEGSDEEFRERSAVPESNKGVRYRMEECQDFARIAHHKYQVCELKRDACSSRINSIESIVSEEKTKEASDDNNKKINLLMGERHTMLEDKTKYERLMQDFAQQLMHKDKIYHAYRNFLIQKEYYLDEVKSFYTAFKGITSNICKYISSKNKDPSELNEILTYGNSERNFRRNYCMELNKGYTVSIKFEDKMNTTMRRIQGMQEGT